MTKLRSGLILAENLRLPYRVLRCAAACFDEVYVLGAPTASKLKTSRYCKAFFPLAASFALDGPAVAEQIDALCLRHGIEYVLPSCGITVRYLSQHGARLRVRHYPVPSPSVLDQLDNKVRFAALCGTLGVSCPETRLVETAQDLTRLGRDGALRFPLIIKPVDLWGSIGVQRVDDVDGLPHRVDHQPFMVQDYIPGEDVSAFYACRSGRVIQSVQYRRSGSRVVFLHDRGIEDGARAIVAHTDFSGIVGFDVRRDPEGRVSFIECNPRFWYRIHLALLLGLNFVEAGFRPEGSPALPYPARVGDSVLAQRDAILHLLLPWRLNRNDRALLRYFAADPLPLLWGVVERAFDPSFAATGAQL